MSTVVPDIYILREIQSRISELPPEAAKWPSVHEYLEDLGLRRAAKPLHPLTTAVTTSEDGHPAQPCVCEACGASFLVLSSCGVPLCLPCWRKAALRSYREIAPVVLEAVNTRLRLNLRAGIRFIGLTCRHRRGETLQAAKLRILQAWQNLRQARFWQDRVDGAILKVEVAKGVQGWHVHLHVITLGRFMPAGPKFAREDEPNLRDEWRRITGDSSIVDITEPTGSGIELVKEIAKYVAKPTADAGHGRTVEIADWPEEDRRELAQLIAGGYRVRWYCPVHRARSRRTCLDFIPHPGHRAKPCQGEYRKERVGFRRLRWYGELKSLRGNISDSDDTNDDKPTCPRCGEGRLRNERWWKDAYEAGNPNAWTALNLIQAHKCGDRDAVRAMHPGDPMSTMPSGWIPPPLKGVKDQEAASAVLTIIAEGERTLCRLVDLFVENDQERVVLAAEDLTRSGYLSVHGELMRLTAAGRRRTTT